MVGGDQNVISGHLKKVLGSRNIQLASPDKVIQTTGYKIGSIPPFSWQPDGFRSFLDLDMMNETILAVGAGVWGNEIINYPSQFGKCQPGYGGKLNQSGETDFSVRTKSWYIY